MQLSFSLILIINVQEIFFYDIIVLGLYNIRSLISCRVWLMEFSIHYVSSGESESSASKICKLSPALNLKVSKINQYKHTIL